MKLDRILLTTDLSEESTRSFGPIGRLAVDTGADVTLLFVAQSLEDTFGMGFDTPALPTDFDAVTKAAEQSMRKLASSMPAGVTLNYEVVLGRAVADEIVKAAEDGKADLIALSTHGRSGIRRLVLGSVAEQVVRRASIPVLSIPKNDEEHGSALRHVLLTTDLSSEALRPFEPVLALAKEHGARVSVLHVVSALDAIPYGAPLAPRVSSPSLPGEMDRALADVEEQCGSLGELAELKVDVVANEKAAEAIAKYASENGVDLIAISSHGRTGFRRAAFGSVAEQVLRTSTVPVLSFHRK